MVHSHPFLLISSLAATSSTAALYRLRPNVCHLSGAHGERLSGRSAHSDVIATPLSLSFFPWQQPVSLPSGSHTQSSTTLPFLSPSCACPFPFKLPLLLSKDLGNVVQLHQKYLEISSNSIQIPELPGRTFCVLQLLRSETCHLVAIFEYRTCNNPRCYNCIKILTSG